MQLPSATAIAVRIHQEASGCSLTSGSPATVQALAAAVNWPLSVMDETTECSLLFHSYINTSCPADGQGKPGFDSDPSRYDPKDTKKAEMSSNKVSSSWSHFSGHNCILADVQLNITRDTSIMALKICSIYSDGRQKNTWCTGIGQMLGNVGNSHAVHKHLRPNPSTFSITKTEAKFQSAKSTYCG